MNTTTIRRLSIEALVIAGLLFATQELLVLPAEQRVATAEAHLDQLELHRSDLEAFDVPRQQRADDLLHRAEARVQRLQRLAGSSGDASTLYEAYRQAAQVCEVHLERMDPATNSRGSGDGWIKESAGFTLGVSGSYAAITNFVGYIDDNFHLTTIDAVRMVPHPQASLGETSMLATIQTRHFQTAALDDLRLSLAPADAPQADLGGAP